MRGRAPMPACPHPEPKTALHDLRCVLAVELKEIERRRSQQYVTATPDETGQGNLVGLALSGGGVRSATFSLGLLQKMLIVHLCQ